MRIIHLADDIQPIRRGKRLSRQRTGRNKIAIELCRLRRLATFGSVNRGHSRILLFRQADPEIEFERPGKIFLPIIRQRFSSYAPHEFVEKKSKRARVIAMPSSRRPQRRLRFQRPNHSVVIEHVNALIQSAKPRLMRKQLPERDLIFVCLPKFGPELRDGPVELNLLLLQRMQYTRAANSFRCRPDQHDRVGRPRFLATRVAKSAVKIDQLVFRFAKPKPPRRVRRIFQSSRRTAVSVAERTCPVSSCI